MSKIIFIKSTYEGTKIRVRPLPNQTFTDSSGTTREIKTDWNVQCDKEKRSKFDLGTVFACRGLEQKASYYSVPDKQIFAVSGTGSTPLDATPEMQDAYRRYLDGSPGDEAEPSKVSDDSLDSDPPIDISLLGRLKRDKKLTPPDPTKDGFYVEADVWYMLVRNVKQRVNTMMIGPTGSGKTEVIKLLAERTKKNHRIYDMGAMHDPMSALLGTHRIGEGGRSVFDYARFTKDITEEGIITLDELSRAPFSTNNLLFPCLDNRKELPVEIAGGEGMRNILVNPDLIFFATANIGGEYTGTNTIDRALIDRFYPIELGYMPKEVEAKVLVNRTGVSAREASIIVSFLANVRTLHAKGELSTSVSTRHALDIASLVADGFEMLKALEFTLLPLFEGTKSEGERAAVASVITSR